MAAFSRRAFVGGIAGLLRGELPQSALRRLRDPATEFEILRYTDPAVASVLAPTHLRSISHGNSFLVFSCNRTGVSQLFSMSLKNGDARQITNFPEALVPRSFWLTRDDRAACCVHSEAIDTVQLSGGRIRTLYRAPAEWDLVEGAPFEAAGWFAAVEKRSDRYRVRYVRAQTAAGETLFESADPITALRPRPRRLELLIARAGRLSILQQNGRGPRDLATRGRPGQALWSADGASIVYLSVPDQKGRLNELREHFPETGEDKLIAPTSQFATFARNGDASVFASVSSSKASPHVLLLLRTTRRELTVSEHKASVPGDVVILFTPDSQRVFYHSDREGKPAIYAVLADRLVEKTEDKET
jgi:oligogalacturonide lyase